MERMTHRGAIKYLMFDWLREGSCSVHLREGVCFRSWEDVKLNLDVLSRPSYGLEFCFVVLGSFSLSFR